MNQLSNIIFQSEKYRGGKIRHIARVFLKPLMFDEIFGLHGKLKLVQKESASNPPDDSWWS